MFDFETLGMRDLDILGLRDFRLYDILSVRDTYFWTLGRLDLGNSRLCSFRNLWNFGIWELWNFGTLGQHKQQYSAFNIKIGFLVVSDFRFPMVGVGTVEVLTVGL